MGNRSEVIGFSGWKFDNPPRHDPLWFEAINEEYWTDFFQDYWQLPYCTGGIYLATVLGLQSYMKNKKAIQLKPWLFMWNVAIGLFSIVGFVRTAPELYGILSSSNGFHRSICVR
ncbi:putative fatty acid elongation protein 4 [Orchesella cincta]|uniref:Putative fatty acid elongation protein 4 n=1 Tax=Orchesella cincta TaxID=48709 RepID=A0A1D2NJX0_ORCCI|nr:putative fatty acid elongation protein 4 [Orchesella cincta]